MLYLSIGENCLAGEMLKRFKINDTWSTPYTWARTNILYACKYEEQNYKHLLDRRYILRDKKSAFPNLWRNKLYINGYGRFESSVSNGFEFTHHDVVNNINHRESYQRKINRMIRLRETDEDILFFYHHRYIENDDIGFLVGECEKFLSFYTKHKKSYIVILTQLLVTTYEMRHIEVKQMKNIVIVQFFTTSIWSGNVAGRISGEVDDDLFVEMFKKLKGLNAIDDVDFLNNYNYSPLYYLNGSLGLVEDQIKKYFNDQIDNLYIWGSCEFGFALADYFMERGIKLTAIIDNNREKQGDFYKGLPIIAYSRKIQNPKIILAVKNNDSVRKILSQINDDAKTLKFEDLYKSLFS